MLRYNHNMDIQRQVKYVETKAKDDTKKINDLILNLSGSITNSSMNSSQEKSKMNSYQSDAKNIDGGSNKNSL